MTLPVQTIEKTAKIWKAGIVLSWTITIAGCCTIAASEAEPTTLKIGALIFVAGLICRLCVKVAIWWNHG